MQTPVSRTELQTNILEYMGEWTATSKENVSELWWKFGWDLPGWWITSELMVKWALSGKTFKYVENDKVGKQRHATGCSLPQGIKRKLWGNSAISMELHALCLTMPNDVTALNHNLAFMWRYKMSVCCKWMPMRWLLSMDAQYRCSKSYCKGACEVMFVFCWVHTAK